MLLILLEHDIVGTCAEDFSQLPPFCSAKEIHLPEKITGSNIALCKVEILIILGLDVRNATLIAADRHAIMQPDKLNGTCLGCRCLLTQNCLQSAEQKENCQSNTQVALHRGTS